MTHCVPLFVFFNDTATTEIYTLSLHDALPISLRGPGAGAVGRVLPGRARPQRPPAERAGRGGRRRSEEHTSELQSRQYLVCRLLLEKKITIVQSKRSVVAISLACESSAFYTNI